MAIKNTESSQGDAGAPPPPGPAPPPPQESPPGPPPGPPPGSLDQRPSRGGNVSAIPQKGAEVNLTLGGIDLNNSGSVVVKADKKLLTVLFPDGRDGRAFTLKAETLEDLYEWKTALETALSQAPNSASVMGQNGVLKNDQTEAADGSSEQLNAVKFPVIGRPILLALEDVDGAPSFLEKALRFIEEHGVKVEGILRQAADVDDVEHRIRGFEQGKTEFSPGEDAHVVADCVKYVIRELPSSPVPASCCNALLEACRKSAVGVRFHYLHLFALLFLFRTDRAGRVSAMRTAICETFPEPNRRLLQRILMMMQVVASRKSENRMSSSAVAACMAPLLLRPLLAGECEIETDFDVGGDGSVQLLQAAAAANHAQAICITLLEEYENIFGEGSGSPELYSDSEESGSGTEEATDDDDESYEDDEHDDASHESDAVSQESDAASHESDEYTDDDLENASIGSCTEGGDSGHSDLDNDKASSNSPEKGDKSRVSQKLSSSSLKNQKLSSSSLKNAQPQHNEVQRSKSITKKSEKKQATHANESAELSKDVSTETSSGNKSHSQNLVCMQKSTTIANGPVGRKGPTVWGRTAAKKNLSMESIDYPLEEEAEIEKLEATKVDLENKIADEVKGNEILHASLEKRKKALHEHRLALEKDVARLQEQLQKEREKRKALEAALSTSQGSLLIPSTVDEEVELKEIAQTEVDVINLKQKIDDLGVQLNEQLQKNYGSTGDSSNLLQQTSAKLKDKQRDREVAATSHGSEKSMSKVHLKHSWVLSLAFLDALTRDTYQDGAVESENEKKRDSVHSSNSRPTVPTHSKKSGTRGEGGNSTSSALTKLTNRLNFLKERRSQIANELQNMDKSRGSGQAVRSKDKDGSQTQQNLDRGIGTEGLAQQSSDKFRKSHSQSYVDEERKAEGQRPQQLDRGRSEGHVSYDTDKSRGQPLMPSRTDSR
ncbi:hypothetical protein JRO89_XS07G0118900 [Xanthoceras sorbifolium]|uniref:Rho-GAP domain-containing protein n=1 Tax=Xanthoceras sorbifolium TaxID=99658 RepID=A0ABQ8HTH6_9ROSI|nr:hypothetical protein JRO89_XS07G0118900 [Xanthoceras sorbifolium]